MAFNKELLKQNMKPLMGGLVLGMLLGAGAAGFAVYTSQAPGRKAQVDIVKTTAELGNCTTALKEAADSASANKTLVEKSEAEKAELQKRLDEAKVEIETLNINLKKAQTKAPEKKPTAQPAARPAPSAPANIRRSARPPANEDIPRDNWEEGL